MNVCCRSWEQHHIETPISATARDILGHHSWCSEQQPGQLVVPASLASPQLNPCYPAFVSNHDGQPCFGTASGLGSVLSRTKLEPPPRISVVMHCLIEGPSWGLGPNWPRPTITVGFALTPCPSQGSMPRRPTKSYCFHISTRAHFHKRRKFSRGYLDSRVLSSIGDSL